MGAARRALPTRLLCRSCLKHQQRQFASSAAPPKPPPSGLAALPSRQLLSVSGPEATKFLQGIITANMTNAEGLPRTDAFYSGFLNATGRVVHDIFIYPFRQAKQDDGYLIEADAGEMARFAKLIKRYKLRAKVTVRNVPPDEASVWQAWDDASPLDIAASESRVVLKDPRAPGLGHRIVQLNHKAPELDVDASTEEAYTIRRYLQGVAEGQDEILREQALPLESNMELMNGIDFHKGCYVGQELTIRTRHRGVVRKRILPCAIYSEDKAPPQTLSYDPECASPESLTADMIPAETSIGRFGKKGRSAGKWLKGVGNIGLGLCRLEIMTDVVLPGEQAAATYKPGNEFVLEWGDEDNKSDVKVKAFVPKWLREGLSAQQG
ncbi:aminomethyltransferase folate-binding domain protein [Metarhizium robertsii]|uniref:Iron-sulfur cluster assembly factor IBA57 homolog, mitochondrial n=2 Tax=Metarhizium robertsii TaxID=568076 RepID=E9F0W7_METRA|nr:aminomethyl transferase [Metarhizium robertsii ARSEF 23]EFY98777.1 aminomethyl transferase [Metarhizium robertsii ARSEF 23]EXV04065.1 aminomethyltransferase folate-binding domain protein [Metarhizium robertsii]